MDANGFENIIDYASNKCEWIVRNAFALELNAFALGFDKWFVTTYVLKRMLSQNGYLKMYTDRKCLFNALKSPSTGSEKRLFSDIDMLRQYYQNRKLKTVRFPRYSAF